MTEGRDRGISERGAAAFGAHAGAETVLLFPGSLRSL